MDTSQLRDKGPGARGQAVYLPLAPCRSPLVHFTSALALSSTTSRWLALRAYQLLVLLVSSTSTSTRSSRSSTRRPNSPPIVCPSARFLNFDGLSLRSVSFPLLSRAI